MKKTITLLATLILSSISFAQDPSTPTSVGTVVPAGQTITQVSPTTVNNNVVNSNTVTNLGVVTPAKQAQQAANVVPNTATTEKVLTPQQLKIVDCNKAAIGKKGTERQDFISECLKKSPNPVTTPTTSITPSVSIPSPAPLVNSKQ